MPGCRSSYATVLALASLCAAGCHGGSPSSPSTPARTFLSFVSEPGDYIGAGLSRRFDTENSTITARALIANRMVIVDVRVGNSLWSLYLAAPEGQQLRTGTYERAVRATPRSGRWGCPV